MVCAVVEQLGRTSVVKRAPATYVTGHDGSYLAEGRLNQGHEVCGMVRPLNGSTDNAGGDVLQAMGIQIGEYLCGDDIERLEDDRQRTNGAGADALTRAGASEGGRRD